MKRNNLKIALLVVPVIILALAIYSGFNPKVEWVHIVNLLLTFVEIGMFVMISKKEYNVPKVILVTALSFMILTWIIPAAYFQAEYVEQGRVQMGLFDVFNYSLTSVSYFGYIVVFILLVGGFYGILYKIPAYRTFLDKIASTLKKAPEVSISIIVTIIALLVSICGFQIGMALFIPLIVAVILLMGYDRMTAAFITIGAIGAGLIGNTYSFANFNILNQTLGLDINNQILVRFLILVVAVVLVVFNVLMYIKEKGNNIVIKKEEVKEEKVVAKKSTPRKTTTKKITARKTTKKTTSRKNPNKAAVKEDDVIVVKGSKINEYIPEESSKKYPVLPIAVLFGLLFILVVLSFVTWTSINDKMNLFDNVMKAIQDYKIAEFPIFAKILGTVNTFGNWTINDLFIPMLLTIIILVYIYKVSMEEVFDGFVKGVKKALAPSLVVILVYTILVLVTYHPFQMVIYKIVLGTKFNIANTTLVAFLASLFNADISYVFQSVLPYLATLQKVDKNLVGIIFQTIYGYAMLVVPTSLTLMAILAYLKISYKSWLKATWKFLLELLIILLIIFIILAAI